MTYVYRVGRDLFVTRAAAEAAIARIPKDWGRDVGYRRPKAGDVEQVPVFISDDEWSSYTGMGRRR